MSCNANASHLIGSWIIIFLEFATINSERAQANLLQTCPQRRLVDIKTSTLGEKQAIKTCTFQQHLQEGGQAEDMYVKSSLFCAFLDWDLTKKLSHIKYSNAI